MFVRERFRVSHMGKTVGKKSSVQSQIRGKILKQSFTNFVDLFSIFFYSMIFKKNR